MKLYLLRPIDTGEDSAWSPWYDKIFGFVIRAVSVEQARHFAAREAGDEGKDVWYDSKQTICEELTADGVPGIILVDFAAA